MYVSSPVNDPRPGLTNNGACSRCDGPISFHQVIEELRLVLNVCACGVVLEYDPTLGEVNAACRICPAVDTADMDSLDCEVSAKVPHVHILPVTQELGPRTLRDVLSHSVYEPLLQEFEHNLEDLHAGLGGRKGDWDEIWPVALALRSTADKLEVIHAPPTPSDAR